MTEPTQQRRGPGDSRTPTSDAESSENLEAPAENDIWRRLRASLEGLANARQRASDPAARAVKLGSRARLLRAAAGEAEPAEEGLAVVAFSKGNQRYAIPLEQVIEVQALDHFTAIPKASAHVAGVVHWRGAMITLLDVGRLLDIAETGLADIHVYLIVEAAGRRIGVVACEIDEMQAVPRSTLKRIPILPGNVPAEWIIGVYENNRAILNMDAILSDGRI